jgi:hypothetical protein
MEAATLNRYAGRAGSGGGLVLGGAVWKMHVGECAAGVKLAPIAYFLVALLALGPAAAAASRVEHLYEAQVIVTGQREDTRSAGLAEALLDGLAKVSGDPRLLRDPRAAEVAAKAGTSAFTPTRQLVFIPTPRATVASGRIRCSSGAAAHSAPPGP